MESSLRRASAESTAPSWRSQSQCDGLIPSRARLKAGPDIASTALDFTQCPSYGNPLVGPAARLCHSFVPRPQPGEVSRHGFSRRATPVTACISDPSVFKPSLVLSGCCFLGSTSQVFRKLNAPRKCKYRTFPALRA